MRKKRFIYFVVPTDSDSFETIYAVFDTKEKAQEYLERFKTPSDLGIVEHELNPDYISDKTKNPYCVILHNEEREAFDIILCDFICQAESAVNKEYILTFFTPLESKRGAFEILLLAASEKEAAAKAIEIRDEVIKSGEWDREHQKAISAELQQM